jgi:hypothetical protein
MTLNTRCLSIVDQTQNGGNDLDGSSISSGGIQGSHFSKDKGAESMTFSWMIVYLADKYYLTQSERQMKR